jgi:hypothetical protein
MALTKAEALKVAQVAERYPPGHGTQWGYGPLISLSHNELPRHLQENPALLSYG